MTTVYNRPPWAPKSSPIVELERPERPVFDYVRQVFALVRDFLIIVTLCLMLFFGYRTAVALSNLGDNLRDLGTSTSVPPLPQDNCGGGICGN